MIHWLNDLLAGTVATSNHCYCIPVIIIPISLSAPYAHKITIYKQNFQCTHQQVIALLIMLLHKSGMLYFWISTTHHQLVLSNVILKHFILLQPFNFFKPMISHLPPVTAHASDSVNWQTFNRSRQGSRRLHAFLARQHMLSTLYDIARQSIRLSPGWISQ